jgi:DNA-directed RNA polymerase subunit L
VSGRAYYAHNGSAFANKNVSVYEDGIFKKNVTTNATGHFVYSFNASDEVGNHTLKFNASDADMIYGERAIVYGVYYNTSTGINWSYNASSGLLSITANYTNASNNALISGNFVINVTSLSGLSPASSQKYCYGVAICNVDFSVGQGRDVRGGNVVIKAIAENESAFYNASSASLATYLEEPTSTALLIAESKVIRDKGLGQEYRTNVTLNITNIGFGTIYNATLGIKQIVTDYNYSVVNREEFCGNLSPSQSCLKNFTVVIGADVEKGENANFIWNASWLNNDGSRSSITNTSSIVISGIARIESVANASYEMQHGTARSFYIRVNSTGNDDVENLNLSLTAITINQSWVNVVWNRTGTQTLPKLCYKSLPGCPTYDFIKLTIAIPLYTDAAVYNGTININTSNANNLSIPLYITVLPNGTWQWQAPSYVEIGYGNDTKPITNITITNRGNIALNFTISYSGNITNEFFFTAAGNQQAFLIQKGTSANLTLFYNPTLISKKQEKLYSLNITFSNSSATPPVNSTLIYVRVRNLPPVISNVVLTEISGRHYVNIPMTITASVDNDDGSGKIGAVWLELRLPNGSIAIVPNSGYGFSPRFEFTPQLVGRYSFTIYANDTSGNVGNYSGSFDVVYDTWKPSIIAIAMPSFVEVGQPLLVLMNASDDLRLDKARITVKDLANNTLADLLMDENLSADRRQGNYSYEASFGEGDYIVSITVNDTSNNKASISKFFRVYHNVSVSGNLNDKNQSANLSLCLPDYLKDYLKDYAMCYQNITLPSAYDVVLYSGMAKLVLNINNTIFVTFDDVNVTELSSDFVKIKRLPTTFTIAPTYVTIDGVAIEASPTFNFSRAEIKFVFNPNDVLIPAFLRIFKCANFTFEAEVCENVTNWTEISSSVVGPSVSAIVYNLSGFLLAEDRSAIIERGGGGGGGRAAPAGGGGGGISWSELERLKSELIKALGRVENLELDVNTISKELYPGESTATDITITNLANISQVFDVTVSGEIADMVNVNINRLEIPAKDQRKLRVAIAVPSDKKPGLYVGSVLISGATRLLIPIELRVLEPKEKMLDLRLTPIDVQVSPGSTLRVQADVFNLGVGGGRVDVNLLVEVVDPKLLQVLFKKQETFAVETSVSKIFTFDIPKDMQTGRYIIRGTANYEIKGVQQKASALSYFVVGIPWYKRTLLGIPIWVILAGVMFIILNLVSLEIYEKRREAKKRYRVPVEFHLLPQPTERAAFVGHIAETKTRAFLDLDQLKMHTIISGSTGSGKTIAAQVICEEALMKNVAVIVFDPSAQWTGFLRKCKEKYMLKHYKEFAMKPEDARAFNGNIHQVTDPRQVLDISKYIVPGEIHIFTLNKLKPRELDFFVASSIKQIFDMNPKESRELKLLLVYDEVHRLLPKFGGAGEGFIQLERGCREFRKWGIGLLLISQVTADFVGAIKANIMTEIQLRTREDSDLDRIKLKYGEDMLKAVVKAAIGTGMVVNPEYNRGRPYFISFRPILHQVTRLDDEELEKYARYNERVEQLEYNIEQIAKKKDVFDLKIELKLALDKIKAGNWAMADIYLEGLEQRVRNEMAKLGIKEKKKEKKYVTVEEIKREVERAKKEREIYVKRLAMEAREEKKIADVFEKVSAAYSNVKEQLVAARKAGANVKDEELKLASIAGDLSVARAYKDKAKAEKILKMLNELKKNIEKKMKTKEKEKGGGK